MTKKILPVDGNISAGIYVNGAPGTSYTFNGTLPPLADSDDTTCFTTGDYEGPLDYNIHIAPLVGYSPGDPISLHVRLSLESTDGAGVDGDSFMFLQNGNPGDTSGAYYVAQFSHSWNAAVPIPPPYDGTPRDLTFGFVVRPGHTLAECVAVLESGDAYLNVNTLKFNDSTPKFARLYEAWLEVGTQTAAASTMRKWPGGLGLGPQRHWPKPRRGITGIR